MGVTTAFRRKTSPRPRVSRSPSSVVVGKHSGGRSPFVQVTLLDIIETGHSRSSHFSAKCRQGERFLELSGGRQAGAPTPHVLYEEVLIADDSRQA